VSVTVILLVW